LYKQYIIEEGGHKVLYLVLNKVLWGCVQLALLWYKLFSTTLMDMGFKLNSYDLCVANTVIEDKQYTIY